jgi:hypothetical protein
MAHSFKTISAKPTFGSINPLLYQSDIINNKKLKHMSGICNNKSTSNYKDFYLFKDRYVKKCDTFPVNKTNLIAGQYSTLDLINVCVASKQTYNSSNQFCNTEPVVINIDTNGNWDSGTSAFYEDVVIDPLGELFGYTQCGQLNFTDYMTIHKI